MLAAAGDSRTRRFTANRRANPTALGGAIIAPTLEVRSLTCRQNGRRSLQTRSAVYSKSS
jgi:hypothetical protein